MRKIAIMAGSYGGYAVLSGLTVSPEVFACGVDIVGPSNLITLLESVPPYWKPDIEQWTKRVGDFRTEEGRKLLRDDVQKIADGRIYTGEQALKAGLVDELGNLDDAVKQRQRSPA